MPEREKATPGWHLEAASKSFCECHFTQFSHHVKAAIYKLAPWLFFMGAMHG